MPFKGYETYLFIGFAAVALATLYSYFYLEKKRREAFRQLALRMGFNFEPVAKQLPESEFGQLPLFMRGHSKKAKNVLRGMPHGIALALFDYQYTVGHGKHSSTYLFSVIAFRLQEKHLPWFTVAPENVLHRLGEMVGYRDIDFPHQAEFSRKYFLRGKDEQAIRSLFQPIAAELARVQGWALEGGASALLAYKPGKRISTNETSQFLEEAGRLASLFA